MHEATQIKTKQHEQARTRSKQSKIDQEGLDLRATARIAVPRARPVPGFSQCQERLLTLLPTPALEIRMTTANSKTKSNPKARSPKTTSKVETPIDEPRSSLTKRQLILNRLKMGDGATIADLRALTGWQPHTLRAAISGLRGQGHEIHVERVKDAPSRYWLQQDDERVAP